MQTPPLSLHTHFFMKKSPVFAPKNPIFFSSDSLLWAGHSGRYSCVVEWCVCVYVRMCVCCDESGVRIYFYLIAERRVSDRTYQQQSSSTEQFPKFQLWPQLSVPHSAENLGFARPENFSPSKAACLNGPIDKSRERETQQNLFTIHIAYKKEKKVFKNILHHHPTHTSFSSLWFFQTHY